MPGQFHRRRYFYVELHKPERTCFGHIGKEWYGLMLGKDRPVLAAFNDRTFYHNVGTYGVCVTPWLEIGLFIDFRDEKAMRQDILGERNV